MNTANVLTVSVVMEYLDAVVVVSRASVLSLIGTAFGLVYEYLL